MRVTKHDVLVYCCHTWLADTPQRKEQALRELFRVLDFDECRFTTDAVIERAREGDLESIVIAVNRLGHLWHWIEVEARSD